MKNISKIITFICISTVFIFSCTTNDYEDPNNGAGRALAISTADLGRTGEVIQTRVGNTTEFSSISIFTENVTWEVTEGTIDILGSNEDTFSNAKKFSARFNTPGPVEVVLKPSFSGPVPPEASTDTLSFEVLPVISASFTTEIPLIDGKLEIEAGNVGVFTNTSSEVEFAEWLITNTTTEREDLIETTNLEFNFTAVGDYIIRLRAFDPEPFSEDFVSVPLRVVPSTLPLEVKPDELMERIDETILVPFNQELQPFTDQESNFTVLVNGIPFTISSAFLSVTNASIIEIKLDDPIYRPDVITVSYDGNGTLASPFGSEALAFSNAPVTMNRDNLLTQSDIYDFENGGEWINRDDNTALIQYTTERASSGISSMKITNEAPGGSDIRINSSNATFDFMAGVVYEVSFDLFLEVGNTWQATVPTLDPINLQRWTDARPAAVPRGEWVTITREFDVPTAQTGLFMFLRTEGGSGVAYIDNWNIVIKEERPD